MLSPVILTLLLLPELVSSVEEGLKALESGEAVEVPAEVGLEAAARVAAAPDPDTLERLVALARAGKAHQRLGLGLVQLALASDELRGPALREVGALSAGDTRAVAALLGPSADELTEVVAAMDDERGALGALELLTWSASTEALVELLERWASHGSSQAATRLLERLAEGPAPPGRFAALMDLSLPRPLWSPLALCLRSFVKRDGEAAELALTRVESNQLGSGAAILASLGGIRLGDAPRWARARLALAEHLEELGADLDAHPEEVAAATIAAAGELLLAEVVPLLPSFALHGRGSRVRAAAARAVGLVCYRDAPTVDLLIPLLGDPDLAVVAGAHESLVRKTGMRIPPRREMWDRWRGSVQLPDGPPQPDAERLAGERARRARRGG